MPINFSENAATFSDVCQVHEAEELLTWLEATPDGKIDLSALSHMHAAVLQVLLKIRPPIAALPSKDGAFGWLGDVFDDEKSAC